MMTGLPDSKSRRFESINTGLGMYRWLVISIILVVTAGCQRPFEELSDPEIVAVEPDRRRIGLLPASADSGEDQWFGV